MAVAFRFAIVSDPHIALPHTIWDHPSRFHLVEVSIPALEGILDHLSELDLDFLLLPGDLTQHGEPDNHRWLADRLARLPFPAYVIPGNHDVIAPQATATAIGLPDFPDYYRHCGYTDPDQLYYTCELVPGVRLIALNSNQFDAEGKQVGRLDAAQLQWLASVLAALDPDELVFVMIHHNVLEHIPGQSRHGMGRRYMLDNAPVLLKLLRSAGIQLLFTGHLHIQDIAHQAGMYEITTGSLVSYPHPYRVLTLHRDRHGQSWLEVESHRVTQVPELTHLQRHSREWMGDRSLGFMVRLLTEPPLSLSPVEATAIAPNLRYFWADIADGDALFEFPHLPPPVQHYIRRFSALTAEGNLALIDNAVALQLT